MQLTHLLAIASLAATAIAAPAPAPAGPDAPDTGAPAPAPDVPSTPPSPDVPAPDVPSPDTPPPMGRSLLERTDAVDEKKPPKSNTNVNICIVSPIASLITCNFESAQVRNRKETRDDN
ncbi:uncharacterized protein PG986_002681 [Apiospora aurea]|uniref:Uncharacterized protein n=1 Tax=Apiospora aurea TaxID=335848 RepID=A0ABR1QR67_9PEZI